MQWLIDLIIEAIGVPPCYIARYDWLGSDFDQGDVTTDGARHTLDLSAIVPENAKAVNLSVIVQTANVNSIVRFFHPDSTSHLGRCIIRTQVANINMRFVAAVGIDSNRHVDYTFSNVVWTSIGIAVRGWWL